MSRRDRMARQSSAGEPPPNNSAASADATEDSATVAADGLEPSVDMPAAESVERIDSPSGEKAEPPVDELASTEPAPSGELDSGVATAVEFTSGGVEPTDPQAAEQASAGPIATEEPGSASETSTEEPPKEPDEPEPSHASESATQPSSTTKAVASPSGTVQCLVTCDLLHNGNLYAEGSKHFFPEELAASCSALKPING